MQDLLHSSLFLTKEFANELLLNRCACRGKQSPGLSLHHLADVTPYIISLYGMLARLIFPFDIRLTLGNISFCCNIV